MPFLLSIPVIFSFGIALWQLAAIFAGFEAWGIHWAFSIFVFLIPIPFLHAIAGFWGAVYGWGWSWFEAILLFGGWMLIPMAAIWIVSLFSND